MTSKEFSQMLIAKGVYPGKKEYSSVKPRGIYKLMPSMWRTARLLEQKEDRSYYELMNQYRMAQARYEHDQLKRHYRTMQAQEEAKRRCQINN
jgi:hypothetical protein